MFSPTTSSSLGAAFAEGLATNAAEAATVMERTITTERMRVTNFFIFISSFLY